MPIIKPRKLITMATLLVATLLFSIAAIYNGYPLVWPDTSGYIGLENLSYRSFFYNLFIQTTHLTGSLWSVVFFQSLIIAHLLRLMLRAVFDTVSIPVFLGVTVFLSLLSSLPWFTGFIMPDLFTPVLVLSLFLQIFCLPRLGPGELKYLFVLTTVAATVHFTHFPLAVGLLLAAGIYRLASRKQNDLPVPYLSRSSFAITLAFGLLLANSYIAHGVLTISPGGYAFPLARLMADGPADRYIREHCRDREYAICSYLDDLPATSDEFLWSADSPFRKVGWIDGYRREGQEIVAGTIRQYPLWTLKTALRNIKRQLFTFYSGDGLVPYLESEHPTAKIRDSFPYDFRAYEMSKQNRGRLGLDRINRFHRAFLAVSMLHAVAVFFIFLKRRQWFPAYLFITITCAYLLNAFLSGAISQPQGRYAGRLVWLFPFFSLAAGLHMAKAEKYARQFYVKLTGTRHE